MLVMPAKPSPLPAAQLTLLGELGLRLRYARLRRRLPARAVAHGAGVTRATLHRVERGEPAVTVGTIVKVMGVLDLANDVALLARDDTTGRRLQDERLPRRHRVVREAQRAPLQIQIDRYPQLRHIAWHLGPDVTHVTPEEALALYERNWRHIDRAGMEPVEAALILDLTTTVGNGILLV
jgi:transcriptional regulator with XRE-family HTH domain